VVGLGLRSAAYQSQIFRGALQSVDEGQLEAARAVGMSRFQAIRHVVVPQALRRSMPGFQNEFTIVLKDTSIAFAIGLAELLTRGYDLFTQSGRSTAVLEVFLAISAIYFVLTFTTNRGLDRLADYYAIPSGENR
jgi:polar amino acid transport system permease protein